MLKKHRIVIKPFEISYLFGIIIYNNELEHGFREETRFINICHGVYCWPLSEFGMCKYCIESQVCSIKLKLCVQFSMQWLWLIGIPQFLHFSPKKFGLPKIVQYYWMHPPQVKITLIHELLEPTNFSKLQTEKRSTDGAGLWIRINGR